MDDNGENISHLIHIEFFNIPDELNIVYHFYIDKLLISTFRIKNSLAVPPPRGFKKIRVDPARHPSGQKHIHIYRNSNDEYVSINQDGTRHHNRGNEIKLSKDLYEWIKKYFPDFNLPADRIIRFGAIINLSEKEPSMTIDVHSLWVWDYDAGIKLKL